MISTTYRAAITLLLAVPVAFAPEEASAFEIITGKVTNIEATYMPDTVRFYLTGGSASCAAGRVLVWKRTADNNKAVYAGVLSALSNEKNVILYVNDGDTSCTGQFIYFSK